MGQIIELSNMRTAFKQSPIIYMKYPPPHLGIVLWVSRRSIYQDNRRYRVLIIDAKNNLHVDTTARFLFGVKNIIRQQNLPVFDMFQPHIPIPPQLVSQEIEGVIQEAIT